MAIEARPPAALDMYKKPLPSLPQPSSPTLTNPDMVLPDHFADNISLSTPPRLVRPPSPSYLVQQGQKSWQYGTPEGTIKARRGQNARNMAPLQQTKTPPPEDEPVIRTSPARRAQYSFSNAAQPTSPTVYTANLAPPEDEGRRLSATASSITSEDLYAMRIPGFAGLDDDTDTLIDGELDGASPSERWRAGEQMEPPETEESAVTLMRAELILANAKKRLNLFDQNLRGAREIVAPLTAANLKRATSMHAAYIQPVYYGRAGYSPRDESEMRQQAARTPNVEGLGHSRVLSDTAVSPVQNSKYASLNKSAIPIRDFSPSWRANALRGARSQEQMKPVGSGRSTPRRLNSHSPEPKLGTLQENDAPRPATAPRPVPRRVSTASDLREQMHELKGRISNLKERAREDSLRRRSMQNLRQTCPLVHSEGTPSVPRQSNRPSSAGVGAGRRPAFLPDNPSPPLTDDGDGEIVFDPRLGYAALSPRQSSGGTVRDRAVSPGQSMGALNYDDDEYTTTASTDGSGSTTSPSRTITDISEESEEDSIYEDAVTEPVPSQRHEDREDAFDYSNFFLHSSLGTFSRPRGSSVSSTESGDTARGPPAFDQVPPTPETPATLREIERNIHSRAMSTESVESVGSFETAREAIRSGRQTPASISEWRGPASKDGRTSNLGEDRADSGVGVSEQATTQIAGVLRSSRARSSTVISHHSFPSVPPSPTTIAVTALLDPKARPLGLKDKALVFSIIESLKQICETLQTNDGNEYSDPVVRKRLDNAKRMLDGSIPPLL